ncbi:MAG: hypothetical protein U9M90_01670 [Patescibacteria group bacterium]|nr:hypothetical protein [Patescibacteria group bacterium]
MLIVKDKNKAKFLIVLIEYVLIVLLAKFFVSNIKTDGVVELAFLSFFLFFLTPLFTIRYIFREKTSDYFLCLNFIKKGILKGILAIAVFVAVMWVLVVQLDWEKYMSVSKWILGDKDLMIFLEITAIPIIVFAKEFFFRGFVLRSFAGVAGVAGAIVLQAMLVVLCAIYIGVFPGVRQAILLFIPNLFLGYIAYVNRSVIISSFLSWGYILLIDLVFAYKLTQ